MRTTKKTKELIKKLPKRTQKKVKNKMTIAQKQLNNSVDSFLNALQSNVADIRNLGVKVTADRLTEMQKQGAGFFATAQDEINKTFNKKSYEISEEVFIDSVKGDYNGDNTILVWTAMFVRTCSSCIPLHGTRKRAKNWVGNGPNERNTLCKMYSKTGCHCTLIPADIMPSKKEMREPIKIEGTRIRRAQKKRGKTYKQSTKTGFIGDLNNPDRRLKDLRKIKRVK